MELRFHGLSADLEQGVRLLEDKLGFRQSEDGYPIRVTHRAGRIEVYADTHGAELRYERKIHFFRGLGLLIEALRNAGETVAVDLCEEPQFVAFLFLHGRPIRRFHAAREARFNLGRRREPSDPVQSAESFEVSALAGPASRLVRQACGRPELGRLLCRAGARDRGGLRERRDLRAVVPFLRPIMRRSIALNYAPLGLNSRDSIREAEPMAILCSPNRAGWILGISSA